MVDTMKGRPRGPEGTAGEMTPMSTAIHASATLSTQPRTERGVLVGRILGALVTLFMLFDATGKLVREPHVLAANVELGWPQGQTVALGVVILVCTILYTVRRTSILGALLLTAFLGGATAAKVRIEDPGFVFSIVMCTLAWASLWLREPRVRDLLPLRR
jgi:hypothetical protein